MTGGGAVWQKGVRVIGRGSVTGGGYSDRKGGRVTGGHLSTHYTKHCVEESGNCCCSEYISGYQAGVEGGSLTLPVLQEQHESFLLLCKGRHLSHPGSMTHGYPC